MDPEWMAPARAAGWSPTNKFSVIAAIDASGGIGQEGTIPWRMHRDLQHFKSVTWGAAIIMGRKTWESIPPRYRPLSGRLNIVLTRQAQLDVPDDVVLVDSFEHAIDVAFIRPRVFVIGGGTVYEQALAHPSCSELHITRLDRSYDCDVFFSEIPRRFSRIETEMLDGFQIESWVG